MIDLVDTWLFEFEDVDQYIVAIVEHQTFVEQPIVVAVVVIEFVDVNLIVGFDLVVDLDLEVEFVAAAVVAVVDLGYQRQQFYPVELFVFLLEFIQGPVKT